MIGIVTLDDVYTLCAVITHTHSLLVDTSADTVGVDLVYSNAADTSYVDRYWRTGSISREI